MNHVRPWVTYSNVIASIALFAALGGGAYAASKITSNDIAKNAVLSEHIKRGQVKAADLSKPEAYHLVGNAGQPDFRNGGQGDCLWVNLNSILPPGVTPNAFDPVAFYKDPYGVVHLTGAAIAVPGPSGDGACNESDDTIVYRLPPAYRPARVQTLSVIGSSGPGFQLLVTGKRGLSIGGSSIPAGAVVSVGVADRAQITMYGVTYRAAGKGTGIAKSAPSTSARPDAGDSTPLGLDLGSR